MPATPLQLSALTVGAWNNLPDDPATGAPRSEYRLKVGATFDDGLVSNLLNPNGECAFDASTDWGIDFKPMVSAVGEERAVGAAPPLVVLNSSHRPRHRRRRRLGDRPRQLAPPRRADGGRRVRRRAAAVARRSLSRPTWPSWEISTSATTTPGRRFSLNRKVIRLGWRASQPDGKQLLNFQIEIDVDADVLAAETWQKATRLPGVVCTINDPPERATFIGNNLDGVTAYRSLWPRASSSFAVNATAVTHSSGRIVELASTGSYGGRRRDAPLQCVGDRQAGDGYACGGGGPAAPARPAVH